MPADPLDKQLVEAVLSRPRRAKADLEEAKLAGLRPSRGSTGGPSMGPTSFTRPARLRHTESVTA